MTEAVGFVSALLGLSVFTYNTSKSLYEAVASFKSQRKTIKDLQVELNSLVVIIGSIKTQAEDSEGARRLEPLQQPLKCCLEICQEMHEMIQVCTKHAPQGRDSVRDWLNMRYREKSFDEMKQRLSGYKSTLSIAFDLINIQGHSSSRDSMNNIKDLICGTREDLQDQLDQVQETIRSADVSIQETLRADQAQLLGSLKSIEWAQHVADTHPTVVVQSNQGGEGTRTLFGTDTSQPQFNLNVSKNEAGSGATMVAGVLTTDTIRVMFGNSQTRNLALALQELQNQSQSTNNATSLSLLRSLSIGRVEENSPPNSKSPQTASSAGLIQEAEQPIKSMHKVAESNET